MLPQLPDKGEQYQVRRAKANYHQDLLNGNCDNPRKFWATINGVFPTNTCKSQVQSIGQDKTKKFSDYFKNFIPPLKEKSMPLTNFTWRFIEKLPNRTKKILL